MQEYRALLTDDDLQELTTILDRYAALNKFKYTLDVKALHLVNEVTVTLPPYALTSFRAAMYGLSKKKANR